MSEYMCDICSMTLARSGLKIYIAAVIQRTNNVGLNLWKTPAIDMYQDWRHKSMGDMTDWDLCPICTRAIGEVSGAAPLEKPSPHLDYKAAFLVALKSTGPHGTVGVNKFEGGITPDPVSVENCFWLGTAYLTAACAGKSRSFLDRAIESFSQVLKLVPRSKNCYTKLFGTLMSMGDDDTVREKAIRWTRMFPNLFLDARCWLQEQEATGCGHKQVLSLRPFVKVLQMFQTQRDGGVLEGAAYHTTNS